MTKEEVSDLQSHVELFVQRKIDLEHAKLAVDEASRALARFIHHQQYPAK